MDWNIAPPPLAFFGQPLLLGWLAVAAAPLIIHLLSRRKYREVPWAAMQYLLAALQKNSRRMLLEQWLLLTLRTLIVVMLVCALAEPFLEGSGASLGSGEHTHKVLVLDASFSMGYRPAAASRFERAKELAGRIVDESLPGDGFSLILLGAPPRVIVGSPSFDPRAFRAELDGLNLPHGVADLPATLEQIDQVLQLARQEHPRLSRQEVYVLSDLGRNTWGLAEPDGAGAAQLERTRALSRRAPLMILDLGQADCENAAITRLAALDPYATTARDVTFEAEVRNFGRIPRTRLLLEWYVDQRRVGQSHVDLEPGGQATAAFNYRFDLPGAHVVEARLGTDALEIDNHRWLALDVKQHLRVLCINGRPSAAGLQAATDYLVVALQPASDQIDRATVRPEVIPESALLDARLDDYDAVYLVNVGQITVAEAAVLADYVRGGGGLVCFLGDLVQPESYNQFLAVADAEGESLLPARLGPLAAVGNYRFDPLHYRHPLVESFRDQEQAGLLTTPIQRYLKLELPDTSSPGVALAFDTGDPALVAGSFHRGRVVLVATSADVSWTAMPVWPSYLPLVQEMLAWAVAGQDRRYNALVGETLRGSDTRLAGQSTVSLQTPSQDTVSVRVELEQGLLGWQFHDTWQSGPYALRSLSPEQEARWFAANVDPIESDLAKLSEQELRESVWPGVDFTLRTDWQDLAQGGTDSIVRRHTLHQGLLWATFALMLAETSLAWYLGQRT